MKFEEGTGKFIAQAFGFDCDDEGKIVNSAGEQITDSFGETVDITNVSSFIDLDPFTVTDSGRVKYNGNFVTSDGVNNTQAIVPLDDETGVLRKGFQYTVAFIEAKDEIET